MYIPYGELHDPLEPCLLRPQLSISHCGAVTDAGIAGLAAGCPRLESLHMDELSKVTDAGMAALAAGCKTLRVRVRTSPEP